MSSGGGSTTVQENKLPAWLEDAAKTNLARADYASKIGYVPNYGIDVAGFTPMQQSSMQNTANAASAFGLQAPTDAMAGMPKTTTNNLGFTGYSSGDLYDEAIKQLKRNNKGQYQAISGMFINPKTGKAPKVGFTTGGSIANAKTGGAAGAATANRGSSQEQIAAAAGYDPAYMSLGTEDFLLGLATMDYPAWAPFGFVANAVKGVAGNMIDKRMDAMQANSDRAYNEAGNGIMVGSDKNGNVYTYSPPTWDNGSSGSSFDSSGSWNGSDFSAPSWGSDGNDFHNW